MRRLTNILSHAASVRKALQEKCQRLIFQNTNKYENIQTVNTLSLHFHLSNDNYLVKIEVFRSKSKLKLKDNTVKDL